MNRFEKWSVWITAALVTISGLGLLWTKYFVQSDDPWAVINHPLQPWFLKAHVVASPLLVFALGTITVRHVWRHYRARIRRARRTGILTASLTLPMILSGYLIQVVTHTGWLRGLALAHIITGVIFAVGLLLHQVAVRGSESRRTPLSGDTSRRAARAMSRTPPSGEVVGDPEIFAGRG